MVHGQRKQHHLVFFRLLKSITGNNRLENQTPVVKHRSPGLARRPTGVGNNPDVVRIYFNIHFFRGTIRQYFRVAGKFALASSAQVDYLLNRFKAGKDRYYRLQQVALRHQYFRLTVIQNKRQLINLIADIQRDRDSTSLYGAKVGANEFRAIGH